MVMSMDAAADQAVGSPMDEAGSGSLRHQESADEEPNEDEQSRASGQTVVGKPQQQQVADVGLQSELQQQQGRRSTSLIQVVSRDSSLELVERSRPPVREETWRPPRSGADDSLVAQMRSIVEGGARAQRQQQEPGQPGPQQQAHGSSGDSLINQAEGASRASGEVGQQKRLRQARNQHCSHHHHHHHHHHHRRPSVGAAGGAHHHHHGQHLAHHQHAHHQHRHHHHHHHSSNQQQQQQTESEQAEETAGDERGSGRRSAVVQQQPASAELQSETPPAGTQADASELKSSTSSVSSVQQQQLGDGEPGGQENQPAAAELSQQQQAHAQAHHHHHHHHCHHGRHHGRHHARHHHYRSHKRRLVLHSELCSQESGGRLEAETNNERQQQERRALQELPGATNSGSAAAATTPVAACCPYHAHHGSGQARAGGQCKSYAHAHQHHARQEQSDVQLKAPTSLGDQEQQHRGHHHHHRHHHHHHHHGRRRHRAAAAKQQRASAAAPDERQQQAGGELQETLVSRATGGELGAPAQQQQPGEDVEVRMHLEPDEEAVATATVGTAAAAGGGAGVALVLRAEPAEEGGAGSEVVGMELSPNSEAKPKRRLEQLVVGAYDSEANLIDSTSASDSNLVTSIELVGGARKVGAPIAGGQPSVANSAQLANRAGSQQHEPQAQQANQRQQVSECADFGAQGASGSGSAGVAGAATKSAHEFSRKQEGDSIKGSRAGHGRLVRQASSSRENSQKELGAGNNKEQQSAIECSRTYQDSYQQPGQPKQVVEAAVSADRRCRLCWCCCCPCSSSLSSRSQPSRSEAKPSGTEPSGSATNKCQTLPNVSLEEIRSWGDSFDRLMKCPEGRKIFQDFLRCEYSEENILFWIACEELKSEKDSKSIATRARDIYEDYISILSAKEVSLDSRVRDIINNNIKKPTSNIFDEAQLQIYTLMHRDSYPRFINSTMYKKLAQIATTSRKGSS